MIRTMVPIDRAVSDVREIVEDHKNREVIHEMFGVKMQSLWDLLIQAEDQTKELESIKRALMKLAK